MELSGRPLFDNPLDQALFVSRAEAERLEENCRAGVNTLLLGERGSGKTSVLRHVLFRLREKEMPALVIDGAPAESPLDLLRLITAQMSPPFSVEPRLPPPPALGEIGEVLAELRVLRRLASDEGSKTILLIDLPPGAEMHQLFGRFRDEIWQLPFTWIVAAPRELRIDLLTPPANAFFEEVVELGPLSRMQQEELLALRLVPGEATPWRLPEAGEDNPRRLLEIVRESLRSGGSPDSHLRALADRELEVMQLGEPATTLYSHLENYGPASASDEDLLGRLGWSRQRVVQVMKVLEGAGLVRGERQHGPAGRPRKVFDIVPPESP